MQRITSESEVEEVLSEIGVGPGEKLRESEKRKNSLEKFAQLRSRNPNTSLTLRETNTAFVRADEELDEFIDITITTKPFKQQASDLPGKYHDYLIQRSMTGHEVGHILYSSWSALEHFMDVVEEDEKQYEGVDSDMAETYSLMFKNFANVLEDGAIERYLGEEFRLEEELVHLRRTIHEDTYMGWEYDEEGLEPRPQYHYPMFYAIMTACLNLAVYDNGELDGLLDPDNDVHIFAIRGGERDKKMFEQDCVPMIRSAIPDIQAETDAFARMRLIYELWTEVRKFIDRAQTSGRAEFASEVKDRDSDSYSPGVPENLSEAHGEQESEPIVVIPEGREGSDDEESETHGEKAGDRAETSHENEGEGSKFEEKAKEGILAETKQQSGDWSDEIEEIINALGAGDGEDEIAIAEDGEVDQERKQKAKRHSIRTSRLFRRKLKHLQRDRVVSGRQRGDFDSRALISAERGSTRVFKQTKKGNEKDYSCMIVVDRSGSMRGVIEDVELAVGSIAWGLEDNGVDVCVLDTENSMTTLSKPFGTSTDSFKQKMFAGRCGGGTPITNTVKFARQRMKRGGGNYPFMIVITDGEAYNKEGFGGEVSKANFPVLGLYMTNKKEKYKEQMELYDRAFACSTEEDVNQKLMNLIKAIIF